MIPLVERTQILARDFEGWDAEFKQEVFNPSSKIGSSIIFENDTVRVWTIVLKPGERLPFHKHTRPYLWVAHNKGQAISHFETGETKQITYQPNDTMMPIIENEDKNSFANDLINIGKTDLHFTTIEFLNTEAE